MPERYTPETLPADADERVAALFEEKPASAVRGHFFNDPSPKRMWFWSGDGWRPILFSSDLNAWPEVHRVLEGRGLEKTYVIQLWGVFDNHHIELVWSDWQCMNATPAERTAALLNMEMEADRG